MAGTTIHEGLRSRINQLLQDVRYELLGLRYGFIRVEIEDHLSVSGMILFRAKHLCGVWACYALSVHFLRDATVYPAAIVTSKLIELVQSHSDYRCWREQRALREQTNRAPELSVADLQLLRDLLRMREGDEPGQDQAPLEHNRVDDVTWLQRWLARGRPAEAIADKAVADALAIDPLEELE